VAKLLQAPGQLVARALELPEAQQRRSGRRGRALTRRGDRQVREAGRDDRRQLVLEPRDLRAQRVARGALIDVALCVEWGPVPADHLLLELRQPRLLSAFRTAPRGLRFTVAKPT